MKALREIGEYMRGQEKRMGMSDVIHTLIADESFRARQYLCKLGFPTQGIGTRLPLSNVEKTMVKDVDEWTQLEAEAILWFRLEKYINALWVEKGAVIDTLSERRKEVIFNMVYQLGVGGVLNFKKMWAALESGDYKKASVEMLSSTWHKQTRERCERLAKQMAEG